MSQGIDDLPKLGLESSSSLELARGGFVGIDVAQLAQVKYGGDFVLARISDQSSGSGNIARTA